MPEDEIVDGKLFRMTASAAWDAGLLDPPPPDADVCLWLYWTDGLPPDFPERKADWSKVRQYSALPAREVGLFDIEGPEQAFLLLKRPLWERCVADWLESQGLVAVPKAEAPDDQ